MAKQDEFVRITLRLPKELHDELSRLAVVRSLNAEIVMRLQQTVQEDHAIEGDAELKKRIEQWARAAVSQATVEIVEKLQESIPKSSK